MRKKLFALAMCAALCFAAAAKDGFLKGKLLRIDITDAVAERGGKSLSLSLSGVGSSSTVSLLGMERSLAKAVTDDRIAAVYINFDHFTASTSSIEEIRGCLTRLSAAGKPVIAYGASLDNASYYLASAADRIFLHPQGGGALTGLASTQPFVKDLLDTLAIDVQLIRHGKFKSAGEMYIRNDISPENREQYEVLLGSVWSTICAQIAESRGISPEALTAMVDGLSLSTARTWLENGLVDGLKYRDEMEEYLCHLFGTDQPERVKTVDIIDYIDDLKKGPKGRKVAVIYANGEIVREGGDIVGEKLSATIAKVRADSSVKAVVFRVNSPGGEVVAADMIRREIELLGKTKPVVASYGAYAASGGYLISAGCSKIFTDATTLTGSIGVFGLVPSFGRAIRKNLKVNMVSVGTNAHSAMGSGMQALSDEELAWYQEEIEGIYDTFVGVVSEGRGISKEAVDSIAQGRVWSGKDAIGIGLADDTASLLEAIEYVADVAGLDSYRIAEYPEKKSFYKELFGDEKEKNAPLVVAEALLKPGFNAIARMPYISIDPVKTLTK
ncbi:MAG: signal peptide peptidase SppA [Bacteroidales bacterium]|nr:signal peptide peptidase SppA [Bacteroidales bacterium]